MPTTVDLVNQVQGVLRLAHGGTGSDQGFATERVMLPFMNDTGGSLPVGTLVKRTGSYQDRRVTQTTAATDIPIGVVVGRYVDGGERFEEVAAAHQDIVAVCILGRCPVLTAGAVTQGQYVIPSSTSGKVTNTTVLTARAFGIFEIDTGGAGTSIAVLTGFANAAATDVYYTINFLISGGGSIPATGILGEVSVDAPGTIISARMLAIASGSAVVDIKKSTYAGFPGSLASICAAQKPTLSSAQKSEDTTLSGWTTTLAAGDILQFQLDSISVITSVTCALKVRRS